MIGWKFSLELTLIDVSDQIINFLWLPVIIVLNLIANLVKFMTPAAFESLTRKTVLPKIPW